MTIMLKLPIISESNEKKKTRRHITLMSDEYSPRDLQFEKIKGFYQKDLMGPSLKQMLAHRKFLDA
jgi:hypothetical protein